MGRFLLGVLVGSAVFGSLAHAEEIRVACQPAPVVKPKPCGNPLEMYFQQGRVPYRCRIT